MTDGLQKTFTGSDMFQMLVNAVEKNVGINDGSYVDESDGLIHCEKCKGAMQHLVEIQDKQFRVPVMCDCRRAINEEKQDKQKMREEMQRLHALKSASLMDAKFFSSTFATYDKNKHNARQFKICKRYADKFTVMVERNQGLLLYGGIGTGKTHTAACIANTLMSRFVPVVMTSFVKILQNTQNFRSDDDEDKFMTRLMRPKLLIIDDLGAERSTDYALEKVYNVIDSRYRSGKPMILTTNLTPAEMQAAADIRYSRIYDRVFEVCYPVEFTSPSWRKHETVVRQREMQKLFEEGD